MDQKKPSPKAQKTQKSGEKTHPALPLSSLSAPQEREIGGYADSGLQEPTRFGDWEVKGRCSDF